MHVVGKYERNALLLAVAGGHKAIVERFLAHGADATYRLSDGTTLLMLSVGAPVEVARRLIDAGADVHAHNRYEETPLMRSAALGNTAMVSFLIEQGGPSTP